MTTPVAFCARLWEPRAGVHEDGTEELKSFEVMFAQCQEAAAVIERLEQRLSDGNAEAERLADGLVNAAEFALTQRTAETLDAERYRYLRNSAGLGNDNDGPTICSGLSDLFEYHFGPECDEVVDAAIEVWKAAGCPLPKVAP